MCQVTPSHAVWSASRRGWVGAHELYVGEKIRVAGNLVAPVEGMRRIIGLIEVFGIEVEYFHNYFVGSGPNAMLVHNGPQCVNIPAAADPAKAGKKLVRYGTAPETVEKLAGEAAAALASPKVGIHGVSVFYRNPVPSAAEFAEVQKYFNVYKTLRKGHYTVELPSPVTQEVADTFNRVFGRIP